jgi:hypothetical protein
MVAVRSMRAKTRSLAPMALAKSCHNAARPPIEKAVDMVSIKNVRRSPSEISPDASILPPHHSTRTSAP